MFSYLELVKPLLQRQLLVLMSCNLMQKWRKSRRRPGGERAAERVASGSAFSSGSGGRKQTNKQELKRSPELGAEETTLGKGQ